MHAPRQSPIAAWISLLEKHAEATQSLQNDKSTTARNLAWSLDFATAVVVTNIRRSPKEIRSALRLIVEAVVPRVAPEQGIFAAFSELDARIFGGWMKDAVFLKWSRLGGHRPGKTSTPGTTNPRITVELDERLMYGSKARLVLVLLHQTTHAYFLTCCAPPKVAGSRDPRLGHDRHFCMILHSVLGLFSDRRNQLPRRKWHQPSAMVGRAPKWRREAPESSDVRQFRRPGHLGICDHDQSSISCSTCLEPFQCEIPADQVIQWYEEDCAQIDVSRASTVYTLSDNGPEGTPRIRAGLGSDFVEFVWDGKAFKIPRSRIQANTSLNYRLARQRNGRELQIPDVSLETFRSLYNFVRTGSYAPELMKVQNNQETVSASSSTAGPPEILETRKDWPDFLSIDIRAVKVAAELGFSELERYALRRLFAQHFTHNDPIIALQDIYEKGCVPDGLRDWVVSFMAKPLSYRQAGQTEQFNLELLQQSLSFAASMTRLMEESGALREDVRRATTKIMRSSQEESNQMAMVHPPSLQLAQNPSHFHSDPQPRDPISLPSQWWNETRLPSLSNVDPIGRRGGRSPPLFMPRLPSNGHMSAYSPYSGSSRMFDESPEPRYEDRANCWGRFY
ncbi:MAG: hypothetical protein Q9165_000953 [Trypethelium subeluteriae]